MDFKLELVVVPVGVDRANVFYLEQAAFDPLVDRRPAEDDARLLQRHGFASA